MHTDTEIDWVAYMQEVRGFLQGERNYMNLRGDTGPLVYPAGFVYIFAALYKLTEEGTNILRAQWIFVALYLINFIAVVIIYMVGRRRKRSSAGEVQKGREKDSLIDAETLSGDGDRFPMYVIIALVLSKRIHSIYMLRMFNDCVAVFCGYLAVVLFSQYKVSFCRLRHTCTSFANSCSTKILFLIAPSDVADFVKIRY
jgi:alpha-1,3-mannosyltransferase